MAHIQLPEGLPGIRGPMVFSPETTKPLCDLVQVLLTGPHTLTPPEREMIATYVSSENDCIYCQSCHGSTAAQHLGAAMLTTSLSRGSSRIIRKLRCPRR
jgi:AhpD family alkylhydroperoxidase